MADIKNLNPVEIWRNFDKLTQVPRPSGHLEKIQAYLLDWAKEAGNQKICSMVLSRA